MDLQHVRRCMEQVAAYRASGLKAKAWAEANGVPLGTLGSWCAHFRRWQAKLDGGAPASVETSTTRPSGFVAARVATPASASSVRIDLNAGACRLELHWPLAHTRELAVLLRELGR
ncbi:MAG: hypothetical protein MUF08_15650 [Burkholderiaceae bacterium]|nr:hypothetical protein [Burkholderiaceae bacterium]